MCFRRVDGEGVYTCQEVSAVKASTRGGVYRVHNRADVCGEGAVTECCIAASRRGWARGAQVHDVIGS